MWSGRKVVVEKCTRRVKEQQRGREEEGEIGRRTCGDAGLEDREQLIVGG